MPIGQKSPGYFNRILLIFYLALSCGYALSTPSFGVPDERAHYLRAYEVQHMHLVNAPSSDGVAIPCREYLEVARDGARILVAYYESAAEKATEAQSRSCTVSSRNTANIYFATSYFFSAIGLAIGESIGFTDARDKLLAGRLMNAIAASFIMFLGFKRRHNGVDALIFLAMLPATLTQIGSLSADSITLALTFRFAFNLANALAADDQSEARLLLPIAFFLGLGKTIQGLFALISIGLLLSGQHETRLSRRWIVAGTIALVLVGMFVARPQVSPYLGNGAKPIEQLYLVIRHPAVGILAFWNTLIEQGGSYAIQLVYRLPVDPRNLCVSIVMLLGFVFVMMSARPAFNVGTRLAALAAAIGIVGASALSMYLFYNGVGHDLVLGIQARYFLPALLALPFLCAGSLPDHPSLARIRSIVMILPAILSIATLL